jgi:FtsZ-binding cell division protein ZapB
MDDIEELKIYIKQLEDENLRLKNSIKALRKNNAGMLKGIKKLQSYVHELKIKENQYMDDIDIVVEVDGWTIKASTDMIEEDVIRQRMGLKPKEELNKRSD